jgi:hypothetical protein
MGVFLGPFGLVLALLVPKAETVVENRAIEAGESKKCPFCAELIKREAIKCRFCGSDLPEDRGKAPGSGGPAAGMDLTELRRQLGHDAITFAYVEGDQWICVCGQANALARSKAIQNCRVSTRNRDFVLSKYGRAAE